MLARCVGKDDPKKYHAVVDILFATQNDWVLKDTSEQLRRVAKQAGMNDETFNACLANQSMLDAIKQARSRISMESFIYEDGQVGDQFTQVSDFITPYVLSRLAPNERVLDPVDAVLRDPRTGQRLPDVVVKMLQPPRLSHAPPLS